MGEIKGLGYVRVKATDIERWRTLGFDVLGFAPGSGVENDALHFRMDERPSRLTVEHADVDRVTAVGWEVRDEPALRRLSTTLDALGYPYSPMPQELCDARRVEAGITLADPGGTPLEIFYGPVLDHSPVITRYGQRFVTGDQGLGHVVMPTTNFDESFRFYTETLGFLSRGAFRMSPVGVHPPLRIRFLGVNQRHHSLALMPTTEGRDPGVIHVMVEVDSLDAVGCAYDQVSAHDFPGVLDAGPPHQRQDDLLLRSGAGRLGHRIRHRGHARRRRTTPPKRSPPTATGVMSGCGRREVAAMRRAASLDAEADSAADPDAAVDADAADHTARVPIHP